MSPEDELLRTEQVGTADPDHGDVEGSVALTSPEEFPSLSEAAAQPQQDLQAQFEFGLRAVAIGLLVGQGTKQYPGSDDASQVDPA